MDSAVASRGMRIGDVAKLVATTAKTLRFYEQIGLLRPMPRSNSAYPLYERVAIETARLVIGLRHLELTISELRQLMHEDGATSRRQRLLALVDERVRRMELELSVLQGRCDDLATRHAALLATPRDRPPDCVCDALLQPC